jgi:hypothetical protein
MCATGVLELTSRIKKSPIPSKMEMVIKADHIEYLK